MFNLIRINMKKLMIAIVSILCLTSCVSDETVVTAMADNIEQCEKRIDEFYDEFDFADTVGETDAYYELCYAKELFDNAQTLSEKEKHYDRYMKAYKRVVEDALDIKMRVLGNY